MTGAGWYRKAGCPGVGGPPGGCSPWTAGVQLKRNGDFSERIGYVAYAACEVVEAGLELVSLFLGVCGEVAD